MLPINQINAINNKEDYILQCAAKKLYPETTHYITYYDTTEGGK
jgi:hypothetical protein